MAKHKALVQLLVLIEMEVYKACEVYLKFNSPKELPKFIWGAMAHHNLINLN